MYVRIMKTQGNACMRKKRTVSGSTLNETMFWTREMFPEYPVTMLNYGSQLIIKLRERQPTPGALIARKDWAARG